MVAIYLKKVQILVDAGVHMRRQQQATISAQIELLICDFLSDLSRLLSFSPT